MERLPYGPAVLPRPIRRQEQRRPAHRRPPRWAGAAIGALRPCADERLDRPFLGRVPPIPTPSPRVGEKIPCGRRAQSDPLDRSRREVLRPYGWGCTWIWKFLAHMRPELLTSS